MHIATCSPCHAHVAPIVKNLKEYRDVHNKKKQDDHTKWLRAQIAKEMGR